MAEKPNFIHNGRSWSFNKKNWERRETERTKKTYISMNKWFARSRETAQDLSSKAEAHNGSPRGKATPVKQET